MTRRSPAAITLTAALVVMIGAMVFWLAARDRRAMTDMRPTAAVLPFTANMIGGDNDVYGSRMTEAVTSELARLGTVNVTPSEIAGASHTAYVVRASVDDEADTILVVATVVDGETDLEVWGADYRGAREDVTGIAHRLAYDISAAILNHAPAAPQAPSAP